MFTKLITFVFIFIFSLSNAIALNHVNLKVSSREYKKYRSKDIKYIFKTGRLEVSKGVYKDISLNTRGQSCLGAPRRCFKVKGDVKVTFKNQDKSWSTKSFNLVSMWQDKGYINNSIGLGFSELLGISDYENMYTTVSLNGEPLGIYLVVQRPTNYLKKSPWIGRRRYDAEIELKKFRKSTAGPLREKHFSLAFDEVYNYLQIPNIGKEKGLYKYLKKNMDIDSYFKLLTLHSFIKNGDYTDEVFFYAKPLDYHTHNIYFNILPWDFEDLFTTPHDMDSGPNGEDEAKEYFRKTILYSFEDPLDIALAKNKEFYSVFKVKAESYIRDKFTDRNIDKLMNKVKEKISPYLDKTEFLRMSRKDEASDEKAYSKSYILGLIEDRRRALKKRKDNLLIKLTKGSDL